MATHVALNGKKRAITEAAGSCEDLVRLLVSRLIAPNNRATSPERQTDRDHHEEILLDIDLDGAHYLLIRLPLAPSQRVQLSPREQEIVRMVAHGHSNKIIADVLNISSWTVGTHLRRIFAKLGVGSRAAMVAKTLEENRPWTQPPSHDKAVGAANGTTGPLQPLPARLPSGRKAAPACSQLISRRVS
jgi:DNA-binding CsgD family transcriptional regulator